MFPTEKNIRNENKIYRTRCIYNFLYFPLLSLYTISMLISKTNWSCFLTTYLRGMENEATFNTNFLSLWSEVFVGRRDDKSILFLNVGTIVATKLPVFIGTRYVACRWNS